MTSPLLLDTCAAIGLMENQLSPAVLRLLQSRLDADEALYLSPISAWEIGLLVARERLPLAMDPLAYFRRMVSLPGMKLAALPPEVLVAASFLPTAPHHPPSDHADRILIATARILGFTLVTRDRKLLGYAAGGDLSALAC
ncbi:MAG: type II toxin-antitoxin system VapC family toxin [Terriglobales bacterium]